MQTIRVEFYAKKRKVIILNIDQSTMSNNEQKHGNGSSIGVQVPRCVERLKKVKVKRGMARRAPVMEILHEQKRRVVVEIAV